MDRNKQLLRYVVERCPGIGRTKLMKLVYLADCESRRWLGKPLSEFSYYWHYYGPYDDGFAVAIEELVDEGLLHRRPVLYPNDATGDRFRAIGGPVLSDLTLAQERILAYVIETYASRRLSSLLDDVVYKTEPMVRAIKRRARGRLDMSVLDNQAKGELLGIDLDRVARAEVDAAEGRVRPLGEVMVELRRRRRASA